eukprot:390309-Ditylum_brightwellii.AAC.1
MKIICMKLLKNGGEGIGVEQTHCIVQEYDDKKSVADGKVPLYNDGQPVGKKTKLISYLLKHQKIIHPYPRK